MGSGAVDRASVRGDWIACGRLVLQEYDAASGHGAIHKRRLDFIDTGTGNLDDSAICNVVFHSASYDRPGRGLQRLRRKLIDMARATIVHEADSGAPEGRRIPTGRTGP